MNVPYAKMTCVMNANMECGKCKQKISDIVTNVYGCYSIDIDTEQATVKVSGKVNPNMILQVLGVGGKHVKIKSVKFEGEEPSMGGGYLSMGGGYPPYPPPPPPFPYGGMGHYPTVGPYDYPMMMPPLMMLPPPLPPPSSSVAALPQPPKTLLLESPLQKSGSAPPPQSSAAAPPPPNSGAAAQPQGSGTSASATADVVKQAVITSDKKSKRGEGKQCSIM